MTAYRRIRTKAFGAALVVAVGLSAPAAAQESQQPVDVTAAPPPNSNTVGPSQLRDFSLGGTNTRPAPAPTPAQPAQTAPSNSPPPANSAAPATRDRASTPSTESRPSPAVLPNERSDQPAESSSAAPTRALPLDVVTPDTSIDASDSQDGIAEPALPTDSDASLPGGFSPWPWLAALLAAAAALGLWWWTRQARTSRASDPGRLAFAGADPAIANADSAAPAIRIRHVSAADEVAPSPTPEAPVAKPKAVPDGLVTSSALKPILDFQFKPDRVIVTETDAVVQFDLRIANIGASPARNILVEGLMVCASPTQDQEIAQFFRHPNGSGDRIPGIAPMDSLSLKSAVKLPIDQLKTFAAGDRTVFVPLVALNFIYGSNDNQVSASYLVGRGSDDDEKLGPVRLDLGPRVFRQLSARQHSSGLNA